jgi:hypothetical protein
VNLLWDYYWPAIVAAVIIGVMSGRIAFQRFAGRRRILAFVAGAVAAIALTALWHGPLGAGDRLANSLETSVRRLLVAFEVPQFRSQVERNPIRRTILLSGPADNFQRAETVRILNLSPGVAAARWTGSTDRSSLPLLAEVTLASLVAFGLGLLLSYLLELRRRSRAEWRW